MGDAADVTPEVTDLRLVAVTPERSHLVLEDDDSHQFRVPVDERLANALRSPGTRTDASRPDGSRRDGQLEIALESQLTPREIQARVRSGHSVDEVAMAAGISADRVERYAVPVLAERAHVVEQAQRAPGRRATGGSAPALAELVERRLVGEKIPLDGLAWDAWKGDDDRWTVRASYPGTARERVATWSFDPRGRVLAPADDEARWLVGDSDTERAAEDRPAAIRRLSSIPGGREEDEQPRSTSDEVYDREADEARQEQAEPVREAASGSGARRRPAVPSWDDIMFGPRRRD